MNINIAGSPELPITLDYPQSDIRYSIQSTLNDKFNELKARLMNLAEASVPDTRQCNALKGLMKDVLNQAYFGSVREIRTTLENRGLDDDRHTDGPIPGLHAKGLSDLLVD